MSPESRGQYIQLVRPKLDGQTGALRGCILRLPKTGIILYVSRQVLDGNNADSWSLLSVLVGWVPNLIQQRTSEASEPLYPDPAGISAVIPLDMARG